MPYRVESGMRRMADAARLKIKKRSSEKLH